MRALFLQGKKLTAAARWLGLVISLLLSAGRAEAFPYQLSYTSRLTDSTGRPVAGPLTLQVDFYTQATGGSRIPIETLVESNVALSDGVFQLNLTLTPEQWQQVFAEQNSAVFIQITDETHNKTYQRQQFALTPYALKIPADPHAFTYNSQGQLSLAPSGTAGQYLTQDSSGNLQWSDLPTGSTLSGQTVGTSTPSSGQVLQFNGSAWLPQNLSSTTSISATAPLTISGSGSLSIGVANSVESGYLTSTDWITFNAKQNALGYTALNQAGDTLTGTLNLGGNTMTNLAAPVGASDAATKGYADSTFLKLSGGNLVGSVSMGGQDLSSTGNILMSSGKVLALSGNTSDPNNLASGDKGKIWFNSSTNQVKYFDGTTTQTVGAAGAGITSLNGLTAGAQTFAFGSGGSSPAFSSSGSVHTLNIPLASASSVTAGLIANSDYTAFNSKLSGLTIGTGLVGGTVGTLGSVSMPNVGSVGTYAKVVTDAQGRVTGSSTLTSSDLPPIAASSITSGTFNVAQLPNLSGSYVSVAGATMTGTLTLPANSLAAGTNQFVLSSGNVGIGTTNPQNMLQIGPSNPGGYNGNLFVLGNTNGSIVIQPLNTYSTLSSTQPLVLQTPGSGGNNVGIGTTSPAGTLDVAGNICFSGANCRSSWPTTGTGTVTSVASGSGLAGGPISTTGTLSLATVGSAGTYSKITTDV